MNKLVFPLSHLCIVPSLVEIGRNWPIGFGEDEEKLIQDNNDNDDTNRQRTNFYQKSSGELETDWEVKNT